YKNPRVFETTTSRPGQGGGYMTAALFRAAVTRPPPLKATVGKPPLCTGRR
ncbi:hypothetical protein KI387_001458, partial [Taxus chinensis]